MVMAVRASPHSGSSICAPPKPSSYALEDSFSLRKTPRADKILGHDDDPAQQVSSGTIHYWGISMIRNHGDHFLLADRKNRMERARLDKQLKVIDKDSARHEFFIERQKRALVSKWQGVSMTTGYSEKALPPDGPHDNVYGKSKYNLARLSEKRLMEWKVRERQLENFLRQFDTRPGSSTGGLKSRPSSSRSERAGSRAGSSADEVKSRPSSSRSERPASRLTGGGTSRGTTKTVGGRVKSASAVLQHDGSKPRSGRCASAVSFSSRPQIISTGQDADCFSETDEKDFNAIIEDGPNSGQSRLRSFSVASLLQQVHDTQSRSSMPKSRLSDEHYTSDVFGTGTGPGEKLNTAQVIENFKSSAKNYEAFIRTHSIPDTKFFITKDSVAMTDVKQQKCRERSVSTSDIADRSPQQDNRRPCSAPTDEEADRMSLSSVCSEDFADTVFLGPDGQTKDSTSSGEADRPADVEKDLPDTGSIPDSKSTVMEDLEHTEAVSENPTEKEGIKMALQQTEIVKGSADKRWAFVKEDASSCEETKIVNQQNTTAKQANDNCQKKDEDTRVLSVSRPMKKLSIVDKKHIQVKDQGDSVNGEHNRGRSCHRTLHSGPTATTPHGDGHTRRHSGHGDRQPPPPSPHTLLMKRRQKKVVLPTHHSPSHPPQNTSLFVSAITVTLLGTPESEHPDVTFNKQSDIAARTSKTTLIRPPSGKTPTNPRPSSSAQQNRNPPTSLASTPTNPRPSSSAQQNRNPPTSLASTPTNPRPSSSAQQNRNPPTSLASTPTNPKPSSSAQLTRNPPASLTSRHAAEDSEDEETSNPEERPGSQWRRDLALERPAGLGRRGSSVGTVLKAAMVFSKTARKRALTSMVQENNVDTWEAIRKERLRSLQSRASVLSHIVAHFPVQGQE